MEEEEDSSSGRGRQNLIFSLPASSQGPKSLCAVSPLLCKEGQQFWDYLGEKKRSQKGLLSNFAVKKFYKKMLCYFKKLKFLNIKGHTGKESLLQWNKGWSGKIKVYF